MRELRVILAFLAAAATAVLAMPLGFCTVLLLGISTDGGSCSEAISFFSWYGFIITLPASLVLGGPLFYVFHRFAWLRWWQVALGGALIGLAAALLLPLMDSGFVWYKFGALSAPLGFLSGLVFWLVGVYHNLGPNKSFKPNPLRGST
jgi:hypothetical protein